MKRQQSNRLSDKIKETISSVHNSDSINEDLRKLEEFFHLMKERGLVKSRDYSLPPLDTIGKTFYQSAN